VRHAARIQTFGTRAARAQGKADTIRIAGVAGSVGLNGCSLMEWCGKARTSLNRLLRR
jgi:hypothetical protein